MSTKLKWNKNGSNKEIKKRKSITLALSFLCLSVRMTHVIIWHKNLEDNKNIYRRLNLEKGPILNIYDDIPFVFVY